MCMIDVQTTGDALIAELRSELQASKEGSSKLQQELTTLQVHVYTCMCMYKVEWI